MSVNGWLREFRHLHERARKKELNDSDKKLYLDAREQFARAMNAAQGLPLKPGETARQAFRVAQAMQVELSLASGMVRAVTLDVSRRGFTTVLSKSPDQKELVGFTLKVPDGRDPLVGRAKITSSLKQTGNYRLSLEFEGMAEADQERLEMALFELALSRLPS